MTANSDDTGRTGFDALPATVRREVEAVLQPGERVLWAGRPVLSAAWGDMLPGIPRSRRLRAVLLGIGIAVSLPILLFLVLGGGTEMVRLLGEGFSPGHLFVILFTLVVLVVIIIPFALIVAQPLLGIAVARHRCYVLTDRQAIVVVAVDDDVKLERVDLGAADAPELVRVRRDGVGDVVYGGYTMRVHGYDSWMDSDVLVHTGFLSCPAAARVAALFREARLRRSEALRTEFARRPGAARAEDAFDGPRELYDFDINFRIERPMLRGRDRNGYLVWTPGRWQNLAMIGFGLLFPGLTVYLLANARTVVEENPILVLVLFGLLLALLVFVSLVLVVAGLTHWPRLVVDERRRVMTVRRRFSRKVDALVRFDDVERLQTAHLYNTAGTERSGPFEVLYALLRDGRRASIAVMPSKQFKREIGALLR